MPPPPTVLTQRSIGTRDWAYGEAHAVSVNDVSQIPVSPCAGSGSGGNGLALGAALGTDVGAALGADVGAAVVGPAVGAWVGDAVMGAAVGWRELTFPGVGAAVVGTGAVGAWVGDAVVGAAVGWGVLAFPPPATVEQKNVATRRR